MLRYKSVSSNKIAIAELADLVVQYERLEKDEKVGRLNEAKRRELGLKKVALYDKYDISLFMLSVPKSKMPEYLAFWPNFWRQVDEFKKANPGIRGPGPFTLPREGRLASLSNGVQSLAKSLGDSLAVQEAVAEQRYLESEFRYVGSEFPKCRGNALVLSTPVVKCDNYDEDLFYFQKIISYNSNIIEGDEGMDKPYSGVYSWTFESYDDTYTCVFPPENKTIAREGIIWLDNKEEVQICGSDSGDASGVRSQIVSWWYPNSPLRESPSGYGRIIRDRYCLDSKHPDFERLSSLWMRAVRPLNQEPNWCDN